MKRSERKDMNESIEAQQDMEDMSSREFAMDAELGKQKNYASGTIPQDLFQYKRMRILPESSSDFEGILDKDFVLSNMAGSKPSLQIKKFEVGTLLLIKSIFVKKQNIPLLDKEGQQIVMDGTPVFYEGKVFDEEFAPVSEYVLALIKSELVGSRGMGNDREAILDVTSSLRKTVEKKKAESQNKIVGFGGG